MYLCNCPLYVFDMNVSRWLSGMYLCNYVVDRCDAQKFMKSYRVTSMLGEGERPTNTSSAVYAIGQHHGRICTSSSLFQHVFMQTRLTSCGLQSGRWWGSCIYLGGLTVLCLFSSLLRSVMTTPLPPWQRIHDHGNNHGKGSHRCIRRATTPTHQRTITMNIHTGCATRPSITMASSTKRQVSTWATMAMGKFVRLPKRCWNGSI